MLSSCQHASAQLWERKPVQRDSPYKAADLCVRVWEFRHLKWFWNMAASLLWPYTYCRAIDITVEVLGMQLTAKTWKLKSWFVAPRKERWMKLHRRKNSGQTPHWRQIGTVFSKQNKEEISLFTSENLKDKNGDIKVQDFSLVLRVRENAPAWCIFC